MQSLVARARRADGCVCFFLDGITFVQKKKKLALPESGYKWHTGYVAQVHRFIAPEISVLYYIWVSHIAYTSITSRFQRCEHGREGEASLFFPTKVS